MTPFYFLLIVLSIIITVTMWALRCNFRTHAQRIALLDGSLRHCQHYCGINMFDSYIKEFDAVTYGEHMRFLMLFRDPKPLYGPLTRSIWPKDK